MAVRSRTSTLIAGTGTYYKYFFGSVSSGSVPVPGFTGTCTDVVDGTFRDHPLTINKKTFSGVTFTATPLQGNQFSNWEYKDYTPALYRGTNFGHLSLPSLSDSADLTKALARTNPSRAIVDVPGFIGELRELPALFKIAGKSLLKRGANAYLSYQYGWKPLISDLHKMLDFQAHVMKREKELRNLYGKGGLRRTFQLSTDTASSVSNSGIFLESSLFSLVSNQQFVDTTRRRWATARWVPTVDKLPQTDAELHKLARTAVYGLSANASTAWNLIPFTWLVDWFSSCGDFFDAQRNVVGATCSSACLMTHTKTIHRFEKVVLMSSGFTSAKFGPGKVVVEDKLRTFGTSPSIAADLHFLSGNQLSILGALGIQRIRGIH